MRRIAGTALAVALATAAAVAQEPRAVVVSEAEYLASLDDQHPAVVARRQGVGRAEAEAIAARTLANPELALAQEDPAGGTRQLDLTLSWQPPGPARKLSIREADRRLEARGEELAAQRLELRLEMRQAYAQWALGERRHRRLQAYAQRLAELAERESERVEGGESSGLAAQRLALASYQAHSAAALVEAEVATARAAVHALSSALPPEALPVLPSLPAMAPAPAAEPPQIAMLAAELQAARLAQRGAEKTLEPPALIAGWQRQEVGAESLEGPLLGVSWSLPLFDRRRAEKVRAAVEVESAEARLAVAQRRLQAARAAARAAYRRLTTAAGAASRSLAGIDSMLFATEAAFAHGELSLTDLLETVDSARAAELSALEVHGAALAAHRRLERLAGHPLPLEPEPTLDLEGDSP